jgi:hypothetical protein
MLTGLSPEQSGKVDNDWTPGEATVDRKTIFDSARQNGFRTGFFIRKKNQAIWSAVLSMCVSGRGTMLLIQPKPS